MCLRYPTAAELTEKVQESHGNSVEDRMITYADYCRDIDKHKTELFKILKEITGGGNYEGGGSDPA